MDGKKALIKLTIVIAVELAAVAFIVWFFDPFYQYHEPFAGLQAVLNDRDNQMAGTIRNFQYDSLLVGSSVAENFNTDYLDSIYGCKSLKVIRSSGSVADLLYYVEMAEREKSIDRIFWCLDIFALDAPVEVSLYEDDIPRYLHTKTFLDDIPYLFNKEILLEKIPSTIVSSYKVINTSGQAYNWAADKKFGTQEALKWYERPADAEAYTGDVSGNFDREIVVKNKNMLVEQIENHPETEYYFLIPPYSMLWWDCAWVNGEEEDRFAILEETIPALLVCENVKVYYFQNEKNIICDLDNYMDMIHYSPDINQYMLEQMLAENDRLTEDNWENELDKMRELCDYIHEEEIKKYY